MKNLAVLKFKNHENLCNCFMRFQEFYESDKFKGKVVSKELIEAYELERTGQFYYENWTGFNLPLNSMLEYATLTELTSGEQELLDFMLVNDYQYVIGISFDYEESLIHEYAHALFYCNTEYREKVLEVLATENLSLIFNYFKSMNYAKESYLDETNAYLVDPYKETDFLQISENFKNLERILNNLFLEYFV